MAEAQPRIDIEEAKKYDYIRFTFADIHGISRSRMVKKKFIERFARSGPSVFEGSMGFAPSGEVTVNRLITSRQVCDGNVSIVPQEGTLHPVPSGSTDKVKVGEVLCEPRYVFDGSIQTTCPRYIARKQLDALRDLGFQLYSAFEVELLFYEAETMVPVFDSACEIFFNPTFTRNNNLLFDIDQCLEASGVDVETLQTEFTPGQFELATAPQIGIKAADNMFLLKDIVKEVADKHGKQAIFMTKAFLDLPAANGLHFNMSLKDLSGKNVFADSEDTNRMSKIFYHWIAGTIKHSRAMVALCCPTVNCYRRLNRPKAFTPYNIRWGVDDRLGSYRVTNTSPESTFLENRVPSGSSNAYLIMAAQVAAGIDGLRNELECPPSATYKNGVFCGEAQNLPQTLSEAIVALEEDAYMVEALGKEFLEWFSVLKKHEMSLLSGSNVEKDDDDAENLTKERNMYMKLF